MKQLSLILIGLSLVSLHPPAGAQTTTERGLVVESIECRGNQRTSCEFIQQKLQVRAGAAVDDESVQNAQLRLSALPGFTSVRAYLEKGSDVGKAVLVVEVVEASPIVTEFAFGLGYARADLGFPIEREDESWSQTLSARISNQNLFGRQKIAALGMAGNSSDATGKTRHELGSDTSSSDSLGFSASATYIDPNVLGTDDYFMSLAVTYNQSDTSIDHATVSIIPGTTIEYQGYSETDSEWETFSVGGSLGYRLWSYSYLSAGFSYQEVRFISEFYNVGSPSRFRYHDKSTSRAAHVRAGWDSEDDAFFPTEGSRLSVAANRHWFDFECSTCDDVTWHGALASTWSLGAKSVLTARVGGEPASRNDELRPLANPHPGDLGITYSYVLDPFESLGGARRGRWYVHLGTGPFELSTNGRIGGDPDQAHLSFGIRLESKVLGLVDLFATGSKLWPRPRF